MIRGTEEEGERAREEEAAASRLQAEARLAREREQIERADELEAAASEHGRRAREAREAESRDRARRHAEDELALGPVTDRLLAVAGRLIGRELTRADLSAARSAGLAEEIASAAERMLVAWEREQEVTRMLQRSLLPEALPLMNGVRLASAFRPADDLIGGDWYDAFRLPGERLAFALGDIVGHGLESAAAAVELRTALRTHALQDADPAFVASRLNDLASVRELLSFSSLVYGVLDPVDCVLDVVSFGHPPLLVRRGSGEVTQLDAEHALLAVQPAGTAFLGSRHQLARDDLVLAYTDGLIERRRGNDETRVAELIQIMEQVGSPEDIVEQTLAALADGPADDDIAVLCVALADPD